MDALTRRSLTAELSKLSVAAAAELRGRILLDGPTRARAEALHAAERVGDEFELWTDLLSRRAAVMWVLRSVYVRVLEDRGLLRTRWIVDETSEQLFRKLAPDLGEAAYLRWIYRDLASDATGLAELFAPTPAEVAEPSDAFARQLLAFWRSVDPDTGVRRWRFDHEDFDSRLLGDLYQDLDPVVKQRYALLQTPDFVVDFLLDETLSPAIAAYGVDTVRLIDPACGSGHLLLAAFHRLFDGMNALHAGTMSDAAIARHVLRRVVGIDLNDYACALARARLVMAALEASGSRDLHDAHDLHPMIFWADGLDQPERDEQIQARQMGLGEAALPPPQDRPRAGLTRPEIRAELRTVLGDGFHAAVANPPFIVERDALAKAYHKEKVGGRPRYVSAYRGSSLCCPFIERAFQLVIPAGHVGLIVANSFMKREFGKKLIEEVLPRHTLTKVVDTSGAYIPGHGTPTVMLFGQRSEVSAGRDVLTVMGKRGEPTVPADPRQGRVWSSIVEGRATAGWENEYLSVAWVEAATFHRHPWSLGGGGAADVRDVIEKHAARRLADVIKVAGFGAVTREDDAYLLGRPVLVRHDIAEDMIRPLVAGEDIRDWAISDPTGALWPYDIHSLAVPVDEPRAAAKLLWPLRSILARRVAYGQTQLERGLCWYEYSMFFADRFRTPLSIAFAFVATHNHFVLDRGGKVFKQSAPVIKLPPDATEADHLALLGLLNSSAGCFWMKQVMQGKHMGDSGGAHADPVHQRFEFDSTKLLKFPIADPRHPDVESLAAQLDHLARLRTDDPVRAEIDGSASVGAAYLREALARRRERDLDRLFQMVALQEELDWLCYRLYGIDTDPDAVVLGPADNPSLTPGLRPFEITLAREDAERRAAIARGEEPDEQPTAWFARHGWEAVTDTAAIGDARYRQIVEERLARTAASPLLSLVEQPTYKRRWSRPDYEAQEREALDGWLADRLEDWAKGQAGPWTLGRAATALETDAGVRAVVEVRTGRTDFSLEAELRRLVEADSVPSNKMDVYTAGGLEKRAAWERTWEQQHAEDRGEPVVPAVPPKYASGDFRKTAYWRLRGKLDVPKERFIAFTEMPGATGPGALYGWAGWTARQRARVLVGLDEQAEAAGAAAEARYGLLYGVWFLLPWVAWESEAAAAEFRSVVQAVVGRAGVTEGMLRGWAEGRAGVSGAARHSAAR